LLLSWKKKTLKKELIGSNGNSILLKNNFIANCN
jgi:hypothetical protein